MKIAILTWLHNGNYGTVLQAYALQRYLRDQGFEVNNIDLHPTVVQKVKNLIKQRNPFNLFIEKFEDMLNRKACPDKEMLILKNERIDKFLADNLCLTQKYHHFSELKEISNSYDAYICGSDQIWSPTYFSPSYFFDFVEESKRKIAYACSFGVKEIPAQKELKMKKLIKRFRFISVREQSGVEILKKLIGNQVVVNVDPTMLLDSASWGNIVADRLVEEEYMFCYFLSYNKCYWEKCIQIASSLNLKLVFVPKTKESYSIDGLKFSDAGPTEWVSLIKNAKFVATDSFHGCVFSIIHRRNFMVFKRFDDNKKESRNTRVYNLLNTYGLQECLVDNVNSYRPIIISHNDYIKVIDKVNANALQSKKWLMNALER